MIKIIISITISLFLTACSSKRVVVEDGGTTATDRKFGVEGETVSGDIIKVSAVDVEQLAVAKTDKAENLALALEKQARLTPEKAAQMGLVIYFDFDSYDLNQTSIEKINKHATKMQQDRHLSLRLEGHTDERGSRDYNLALGENRALAVKNVLALYDLSSRIDVVSYGEEKPIDEAHNEAAWQKNRRVELIFY